MATDKPTDTDGMPKPPTDRDWSEVRGCLKRHGPPFSLEDMQTAIEEGAAARYWRAVGENLPVKDEP